MSSFFKEIFSESTTNGTQKASSKRVMGVVTLVVALCCMVYLTWVDHGTTVVENLLQTAMIMAASLLGISSVTGIWKGNSMSINDKQEEQKKEGRHPHSRGPELPKCPYIENIEKGTD